MEPEPGASRPSPADALASAAVDDFVYAVSHDLRASLLNLQGFLRRLSSACQTLQSCAAGWDLTPAQRQACSDLLEHRIRSSLEVLYRSAHRMDRLLEALLGLSRAGSAPVQARSVATSALLRALVEELRPVAEEKEADIDVEPAPDLWGDPDRVTHVFRRLLDNALKFLSPERPGRIAVGGAIQGSSVVCWVRDNGVGIKLQDQGRIFLPFGKTRETDAPGEGIGLATVRKLMFQQGGQVWVESTHGHGSTFYLGFPAPPAATGV